MSNPLDDADLTSLDAEQRALFDAAFGVDEPTPDEVDCGVDAVMSRLATDERHDVLRAAFTVAEPTAAHREASILAIADRVQASRVRPETPTHRVWLWPAALAAIALLAVAGLWMIERGQSHEVRSAGEFDRDLVEVRHIESPQALISVQKVSQAAARRIVQRVGGGGLDAARKATGRTPR